MMEYVSDEGRGHCSTKSAVARDFLIFDDHLPTRNGKGGSS